MMIENNKTVADFTIVHIVTSDSKQFQTAANA